MKTATKTFNCTGTNVCSLKWAAMLLLALLQLTASAQGYASKITLSCEGQGTAEVWDYYGDYNDNRGSRGTTRRLVATPVEHWKFKEWQLVSGDGEIQGGATNATAYYKFGDKNAQIKAVFYQALDKVEIKSGSGKAEVDTKNPRRVHVKPDEGYKIDKVYWIRENDNREELTGTLTTEGWRYYDVSSAYGYVEVYFTVSNDVRVLFVMKGYGTDPGVQDMTFSDDVELRATKPANPTDEEYTFKGWFTDSKCTQPYDFNTVLSKDNLPYDSNLQKYRLALYAKWTRTECTITFHPNCSEWGGLGTMPAVTINNDETPTYTIPECTFVHPDGKKCIGWATKKNGKVKYFIGEKIALPKDMRLYAKWETISGTCGSDLTWEITQGPSLEFDVLTISGSGTMNDYKSTSKRPWYNFVKTIRSIKIEEGVGTIGQNAFNGFVNVTQPVTIPASVKKIGERAFYKIAKKKKNPGTSIATVTDSKLEEIDKQAFMKVNASIDLSSATSLDTIPGKLSIFKNAKKDITLPSSITLIEANKTTSFELFKGDHVYYPLPEGKWLSVNNTVIESNEISDGRKVDLIHRIFDDDKRFRNRKKSRALSLALLYNTEPKTITIPTGEPFKAYKYGVGAIEISQAYPGERVVLSWDGEGVEAGKYISDFFFTVNGQDTDGVTARANDDNTDYSFIMPFGNVEVSSYQLPQEEYLLDLTKDKQVVIPESMFVLLHTLGGYYRPIDDPNTGQPLYYIDLNRDGTPDLELTEPFYESPAYEEDEEDEEDEDEDDDEDEIDDDDDDDDDGDGGDEDPDDGDNDEGDDTGGDVDDEEDEDPFKYDYSVKVLDGAQLVTTNCRFDLIYTPFPYRYNRVLVKLSDSYETKAMERLETLHNKYDNSYEIAEWAGDGKTHNLQLLDRLLYKDGDWNTLCLPCDVTIASSELDGPGVEARPLSSASIKDKVLTLNFGDPVATLEAGVPYIIKWDEAPHLYEPMFPGVTIPDLSAYGNNETSYHDRVAAWLADKGYDNKGLTGDARVRFLGTVEEISFTGKNTSILFLGADNKLYYPQPVLTVPDLPYDSDTNPIVTPAAIGAFRAYFKIGDDSQQAREIDGFAISFGDASGIVSQPVDAKDADAWYTPDGVKLNGAPKAKGLYIHGKRKVVVGY